MPRGRQRRDRPRVHALVLRPGSTSCTRTHGKRSAVLRKPIYRWLNTASCNVARHISLRKKARAISQSVRPRASAQGMSCLRPGEPVEKWIVCGAWHVLAVDIRLGEGAIWMAKRHINHQFVDAAPKRSAAGLEVRGPQCLLWSFQNRRHMRVSKLRVGDGTAI